MNEEEKVKLVFRDKKNNKYILELKDDNDCSFEMLVSNFERQYGFDATKLEIYVNDQKYMNVIYSYEELKEKKLIISNIKHAEIELLNNEIKQDKINNNEIIISEINDKEFLLPFSNLEDLNININNISEIKIDNNNNMKSNSYNIEDTNVNETLRELNEQLMK